MAGNIARKQTDREPSDGPLDFGGLSNHLGYCLRRAQLASFQNFRASFAALDLRPTQYSVLVLINNNPGRKQSEIAAALGIKRSKFVSLMAELERSNLAERRKAQSDRRSHALFLTEAGVQFMKKLDLAHQHHQDHLTAKVGEENSALLIELLKRIGEGGPFELDEADGE